MSKHTQNDLLIAEYVLGTLRGPARRRFESLMGRDPALAAQVCRWQEVFGVLDAVDTPVRPPGRVWHTIQSRLPQQPESKDSRNLPSSQSPLAASPRQYHLMVNVKTWLTRYRWRLLSFALAVSLVGVMLWPRFQILNGNNTESMPVAVLASAQGQAGRQIVVSVDARGRKLILTPLNLAPIETGHSLELWLIAKGQKPTPLGLIRAHANTVVVLGENLLSSEATLAVSIEQAGGSPTGQPTGEVLYAGKVGKI